MKEEDKIKQYLDKSLFLDVNKGIHKLAEAGIRFDIAKKINPEPSVGLILKTEEVMRGITFDVKGKYGLDRRR